MRLLALEASATAASVALCEDDLVIGEYFLHTGKTHSQTLLPAVEQLLAACDTTLDGIDCLSVSTGPGSFTGLRIAIAAVKGMAMGASKPCVGVSSLYALALNLRGCEGVAVAAMDARCGQVYTAIFDLAGGAVARRCDDMAIPIEDLVNLLDGEEKPIFLVGDGAVLCYNTLLERLPALRLAPTHLRLQRASSVACAAAVEYHKGNTVTAGELVPSYLRLPQAERELLQKNEK